MSSLIAGLSQRQSELLGQWMPGARVVRDHGWGLVETVVVEVTYAGARFIVKAGGANDRHIAREIEAHQRWLQPWTSRGRAAQLVRSDAEARIIVTRHVPGELVLGHPSAHEPDTYRQAGTLLALLHSQTGDVDPGFERRENEKAISWLDGPHRIDPAAMRRLRAMIKAWPVAASVLVPTHGDWQPRNWLIHDGVVSVIDFGRSAMRPAMTDFSRLAAQEFSGDPSLEKAFLEGYGRDPREPAGFYRQRVRDAIGTACWAFRVGDSEFEAQGHRMVAEVLAGAP